MRKQFYIVVGLLFFSFIFGAWGFYVFEQDNNSIDSFADVIWWWIVTSATVGYGDIVPQSFGGRLVGSLVIILGIVGYTYTVSLILNWVKERLERQEKGLCEINVENHILICEYTAFADELIQELPQTQLSDKPCVILTALVDRKPYAEHHFVYGVPISPTALSKAHVDKASHIFIFSNTRFAEPDTKTLHILSRIIKENKTAKLFVELNNPNHKLLNLIKAPITVMPTEQLLESCLQHKHLELSKWLD